MGEPKAYLPTCISQKSLFGTHYFISFGRNKMTWHDDIILFWQIHINAYQISIKIRHEMKTIKFQINFITNSMVAKQVIVRIINEFCDPVPND
jgi:hypothetical protein